MQVCMVQFKKNSRRYFFSHDGIELKEKDFVVVETIRGLELGSVCKIDCQVPEEFPEIKPILRIANDKDFFDYKRNEEMKKEAFSDCKKLAIKNELDMKIVDVEFTLDHQKLHVSYEASNRVDFRQFVKDLAEIYHIRIEMRQISSRESSKILGGLGPCGLVMCCNSFLNDFDNITIKMAKNQNLSLNPQKINGACGKLLCCIRYENDVYTFLKENLPDAGDVIDVPEKGKAKVLSINVLTGDMRLKMLEDESFLNINIKDFTK